MERVPSPLNSTIFLIAGGPASGKGTIGRMLAEDYGFYYLSVGQYLRRIARNMSSQFRSIVQECIYEDELVPNGILMRLLGQKMAEEENNGHTSFLIDGIPRSLAQAKNFDEMFGRPLFVIWLQCAKDITGSRFEGPETNSEVENYDLFEKRFHEFWGWTDDVWDHYLDVLVTIDNEEEEPEEVYDQLIEVLDTLPGWINMLNDRCAKKLGVSLN